MEKAKAGSRKCSHGDSDAPRVPLTGLQVPGVFDPDRYAAGKPLTARQWLAALDVRLGLWVRIEQEWGRVGDEAAAHPWWSMDRCRDVLLMLMRDVYPLQSVWSELGDADSIRGVLAPAVRTMRRVQAGGWMTVPPSATQLHDLSPFQRQEDAEYLLQLAQVAGGKLDGLQPRWWKYPSLLGIRPADVYVAVDVALPDHVVRAHFAAWLKRQRNAQARLDRPMEVTQAIRAKWTRYRLLAVADLMLWAALFDSAWTPAQYQRLLFPTWPGEPGARFRKTVRPLFDGFFRVSTRDTLVLLSGSATPS